MSKTISLHHIVFATRNRRCTIPEQHKKKLYAYISGVIKNKNCYLHRLNGIENHIHLLIDLHPSVALADFVKSVKQSSSVWMKQQPEFSDFDSWANGYYAASLGIDGLESCKEYIKNQESHHYTHEFMDEMEMFARRNNFSWYPDDFS
ncbi:MAG: IS200/IS605 family transposase [Muribaculaceae bacterium]|nr:IS200/IS605 family transposase [Muribaculaceae bacterium]